MIFEKVIILVLGVQLVTLLNEAVRVQNNIKAFIEFRSKLMSNPKKTANKYCSNQEMPYKQLELFVHHHHKWVSLCSIWPDLPKRKRYWVIRYQPIFNIHSKKIRLTMMQSPVFRKEN